MNRNVMIVLGLVLLGGAVAWAGEAPEGYVPPKLSDGLSAIKALEGKWTGTGTEHGKEGTPASIEYHVTSSGTAVEERLFPGTPHEMVSMYHDVNGKLSLTHYCSLGNQPELGLVSSESGKWVLEETAASSAALSGQMRMSRLVVELPDKDTLVQTWTAQDATGKTMDPTVIKLKRV